LEINNITLRINKNILKNIKDIGKIQQEDNKLKCIINSIQNKADLKLANKYQYVNNTLYRQDKRSWKVYVPKNLRDIIIKEFHTVYGHCGMQKTEKLFKEYFTGDQINKTVYRIIRSCDICQRCKDHHRENYGETKPMIPKQKGEMVSIDFYGPLVTSSGGVKYILVMVDNFTKFVKLYTLKRATTRATLRKL
jgi:hypothetical protein